MTFICPENVDIVCLHLHTNVCVRDCLLIIVFLFSYYFKCLYPLNIVYTTSFFSNTGGQTAGCVHSL